MPVHPATETLKPAATPPMGRQAIGWAPNAIEPLPAELRARQGTRSAIADALKAVHFPESEEDVEGARKRLAFEELFLYQAAARDAAEDAPDRAAGAEARGAGGAGRALDRVAAVRADRRTSCRRSTRSTPTSTRASRCSGC